ncbi:2-amino-4-hydroxy-6-hydroxymethyldihydropteridine diphosphokinase [Segatella salivae]|jgi:2-amino-4-hydroxy-6-hydroxymethyldihydropteridine diphosphokinase|uniref:2-amino-4-hydroxy-6- hydroxymethyldihydropteridine diphosphokinase n=1 Tax=Segatella salivae TaxID=228604 RepID=UPI001CAECA87|nr:2-amino-4-hydroxy-6-hydroxymethyldihydropteridine diphosphokinase [Segatella salivae]MBF1574377.1 2-amino-4-hydroxy-6-hydroxymethyldihydropteridine diphosphokinase [Segatella salivae]
MIDQELNTGLHTIYLGLGSNIGNRKRNMRDAIQYLESIVGTLVRQSDLFETEPWGFDSPNLFINMCVCMETPLSPRQLLEATQSIEKKMGRTLKSEAGEYADRIIDIDILIYDDLKINDGDLIIPHPLMHERDFVMIPLRQILE